MPNNLSALLFCASKSPDQKTLPAVEKEREELKDLFLKMQNGNRLKLIEEDEYTSGDLAKRIDIVNKHQVLLHIGGHANGEKVLGADGAIYVEGICESIRLGENELILAFINGCSSLDQAEKYFKIGGKVVIATTTAVEDFPAKDFALRFYECLSQRDSIEQAFGKASALVKGKGYSYDSIDDLKIITRGSRSKNNDDGNKLPWRLVYQEENQEYLNWRIPLVSERLISWSENTGLEVIGRETEIKDLHSRLKDKNRVAVQGLAGMGKSALAREYLKQYESEYKYTIWIDQNGTFKSSLAGHSDLCEKLKLSFTGENIDTRYTTIVKKLDEIADPNYPSLLVVDNAAADLGAFTKTLPDSNKWKILATSRQNIPNFAELELDKLQPDKARELFLQYYPVDDEKKLKVVDQILAYIGYHTLTIECSAKSLKGLSANLDKLFDSLKSFKLDTQKSSFSLEDGGSAEKKQLLQHLLAIFNGVSFSEEEKTLLIQLALMPPTDLPFAHLEVLLAGTKDLEEILVNLEDRGWISIVFNEATEEKSIRLHRLIKEVIKYQFSKDEETDTYTIRLLKKVAKDQFSKNEEAGTYNVWKLREPAERIIQNLIHSLEDKNFKNNFELLIYYFEINHVFSKDVLLDTGLNPLHYQWNKAFNSFLETINEFSQKEYIFLEHLLEVYPETPSIHFGLGNYFVKQKKWHKAVDVYQKAIELDPKFAEAYNNLGAALYEKGDLDGAIDTYQKAIELNPKELYPYYNLGTALQDLGDLDGAIHAFQKAIEIDPNDVMVYNSLGIALKANGNLVQAILTFQKAIEIDPNDAIAYYNLGNAFQAKGDLDKAFHAYQQAIEFDPNFADAYSNLGDIQLIEGDLEGAIDTFQKAIEIDPKNVIAFCSLGFTLNANSDLKGAIEAYQQAIEFDPKNAFAFHGLGTALHDKGDLEEAIEAFQKAIEFDPNSADAYYNLGLALHDKGDLDGAIDAFNKAIEIDPKDARTFFNLGNVLKAKGELDSAIDAFTKAIEIDPKFAEACLSLGIALKVKGDLERAILACQKAIEIDPKYAYAYFNLGSALHDKGDLDQAIDAFQMAIEIDPKHASAYLGLGLALLYNGDLGQAIDAFQMAIEINPQDYAQDSGTWNSLGSVQLLQNLLAEAKYSFLKAWELNDEKEYTTAMNLGHIELFSENHNEAMIWYLKSVTLAENKEEFFQGMGADYQDLEMEDKGISPERYTGILAQLRLSIGS